MADCEHEHPRRESSAAQSREHSDSDQFDRAIDRKIERVGRAIRKRALGWVFSTGLGASATAGVMTMGDEQVIVSPELPQQMTIAASVSDTCATQRDLRLLLDYLKAIVSALRESGIPVDEPRPPTLRMDSHGQ